MSTSTLAPPSLPDIALPDALTLSPSIVPCSTGHFLELGDHRGHVLISSAQSGGAFLLVVADVDHGGGPPPHIHRREEETFVIQAGRFEVFIGGEVQEVGAGASVFAPRGVPHGWRCVDENGGRIMILVTPGENFERFAVEMAERALLSLPLPEAIAALNELGSRHGIEMLPPPGVE